MNWENFFIGIALLVVSHVNYKTIKQKKQNSPKDELIGKYFYGRVFSVIDIGNWGIMIICFIVGIGYIIDSL